MRTFKPGDRVKVIAGPRAGEISTVTSALLRTSCPRNTTAHAAGRCFCGEGFPMVHELDTPALFGGTVAAPPAWLEPWWDGKDAVEWSETLRKLCGLGTKERERA